jgi:hypothetical protein
LSALLLLWPAFVNGYPIVGPDSVGYVGSSSVIVHAIRHPFTRNVPLMRSELYSLSLLFLHWHRTLWPVVIANALVTAYIVWLVVRSMVVSRPKTAMLLLTVLLSAGTAASWYVSSVLTDALSPVTALALCLLAFCLSRLSQQERWAVTAIAAWGMAAHMTYLTVSCGLFVIFAVLLAVKIPGVQVSRHGLFWIGGAVLFTIVSQTGFNWFLYGKPSLNGDQPPYLMARILADGTGSLYLQKNCKQLRWTLCNYVDRLPSDQEDFLWRPDGLWTGSSAADRKQLQLEERPLILGTLREFPRAQISRSSKNAGRQLVAFSLLNLAYLASGYTTSNIGNAVKGAQAKVLQSRQARGTLPLAFFDTLETAIVTCGVMALVVLLPVAWVRRKFKVTGFAVGVLFAVLLNAVVCGVLAGVDVRYGARMIWMLPLMAFLLAGDLFVLRPMRAEVEPAATA